MTFDFVAPVYDRLARLVFGSSLLRAQRAAWQPMRSGAGVLVLGGGSGAFLPDLLLEKQPRRLLYLESSGAMLNRAKRQGAGGRALAGLVADSVEWRHGTEAALRPGESFDYMLLPFVLDLYPPDYLRTHLLPRLLTALRPGGALIVTDFDRPKTRWQWGQLRLMIWFFRLTANIPVRTWTDWPQALRDAGLTERHQRLFRHGQVRSGCWVRAGGAGGLATAVPAPAKRR